MTDQELEQRVREALEHGCVSEAKQWAESIADLALRRDMLSLINGYENF